FRKGARSQSPATRHDLVLCRKWENFCISVGSDDRWIFLRLFRSQGPASHRILSDGDRINNPGVAGAVLLATHRNSLGDPVISPVRPVSFEKPRLASARSSSRCALSSNRVCSLLRKARPQGASPANVFEWGRSGEL